MRAPSKPITREQFAALVEKLDFRRRMNIVHLHSTCTTASRKRTERCSLNRRLVKLQPAGRASG
jgi:hypothetical protein